MKTNPSTNSRILVKKSMVLIYWLAFFFLGGKLSHTRIEINTPMPATEVNKVSTNMLSFCFCTDLSGSGESAVPSLTGFGPSVEEPESAGGAGAA